MNVRSTQRNQAVERALEALAILSNGETALPLQELSRRLGLHPSTAHRLLKPLEELGYLSRSDGTDMYRLGSTVLTLAGRMLAQIPVRAVAAPYLRRLSAELGETVALARYENGQSIYLDSAEGPNPVGIFIRSGSRLPAHCVASGRAQLAFLGDDEVEHLIERGLSRCGAGIDMTADMLRRDLTLVRGRGYAFDDSYYYQGVRAAAAPILDSTNMVVGAISVVGFASTLPLIRLERLAERVAATTAEISALLGFEDKSEQSRVEIASR